MAEQEIFCSQKDTTVIRNILKLIILGISYSDEVLLHMSSESHFPLISMEWLVFVLCQQLLFLTVNNTVKDSLKKFLIF